MDFKFKLYPFAILLLVGTWGIQWSYSYYSASDSDYSDRELKLLVDEAGKQMALLSLRLMVKQHYPLDNILNDHCLLLRFISATKLNTDEALHSLREYLAWRKAEKVDGIREEDWSDMEEPYPYEVGTDVGNSLAHTRLPLGKWDWLGASKLEGKEYDRFFRYASVKIMADVDRKAQELDAACNSTLHDCGFYIFVDLKGIEMDIQDGNEVIRRILNAFVLIGGHWKEATRLVYIMNAPVVPDFGIAWSTKGGLTWTQAIGLGWNYTEIIEKHKVDLEGVRLEL